MRSPYLPERSGLTQLLAVVCQGRVGAVLALEASRLARNSRDWHHLIDLCAFTETLLWDADGVYDPRQLNDRLLLGMKGSMAEYALGLLRQRAREAFEQKIRRGPAMWEAPVGLVRTEDDRIEKSADRQAQHAIAGVFAQFRALGSARQTTLWYRDCKLARSVALLLARCVSPCAGLSQANDEALAGRFHDFFGQRVQPIQCQETPDLGKEALQ
jgi:DNA invertase Pin-like site-specific DNA recombinase